MKESLEMARIRSSVEDAIDGFLQHFPGSKIDYKNRFGCVLKIPNTDWEVFITGTVDGVAGVQLSNFLQTSPATSPDQAIRILKIYLEDRSVGK